MTKLGAVIGTRIKQLLIRFNKLF